MHDDDQWILNNLSISLSRYKIDKYVLSPMEILHIEWNNLKKKYNIFKISKQTFFV